MIDKKGGKNVEIITETLIDGLKLLPFLFITFLVLELIEHKTSKKNSELIHRADKFGPLIGSILGAIPQCGFSVMATNFYAMRVISLGTLIAIYLSTSDEMLPLLISKHVELSLILTILFIKIIVGMICGFLIDILLRKEKQKTNIKEFCEHEHCDCKHNILKSALKHTLHIFVFIMIITFLLNAFFEFFGKEKLGSIFMKNSIFGPFITSFIGLIPNCVSSIVITELYLNSAISFASLISGLLTNSGIGILLLFKVNKDKKQNFMILLLLYLIGILVGLILNFLPIYH